jgi:hypothetical protein
MGRLITDANRSIAISKAISWFFWLLFLLSIMYPWIANGSRELSRKTRQRPPFQ